MGNNLFISYDLHSLGQNYEKVSEVIKSLGNWAKVQYSLWYVNSDYTCSQASEIVWKAMDNNDSLIVIDTTNNTASWYGISNEVSEFIKDHWYK